MSERQQAQRQQHKRRRKSSPSVTDDNETTTDVSNDNDDNDDGNANNAISDPLPPGIDITHYRIVKRVPHRAPTRQNEIYVSRKSQVNAQLARAKTLLLHADVRKRVDSVVLFGLGAAMAQAVNLALRIVEDAAPSVVIDCVTTTGTTALHDDYEPLVEGVPAFTRTRYNGFLRIDLTRRPTPPSTTNGE